MNFVSDSSIVSLYPRTTFDHRMILLLASPLPPHALKRFHVRYAPRYTVCRSVHDDQRLLEAGELLAPTRFFGDIHCRCIDLTSERESLQFTGSQSWSFSPIPVGYGSYQHCHVFYQWGDLFNDGTFSYHCFARRTEKLLDLDSSAPVRLYLYVPFLHEVLIRCSSCR